MDELVIRLLQALALLLIIEGILPFLFPHRWRQLVAQLASITDANLRVMGLLSMLVGLLLLWLVMK